MISAGELIVVLLACLLVLAIVGAVYLFFIVRGARRH